MNAPDRLILRQAMMADLMGRPALTVAMADPNRPLLASLLTGQALGEGCLPARLGLDPEAHAQLLHSYFPGPQLPDGGQAAPELPEFDELFALLDTHRALEFASEAWMTHIVARACAGSDHLWQDLGLANRAQLSRLMWNNFPELARANTGDMKWKKFLYRQLCAREGIYVCPAPTCAACADYARCFGPEN